MNPASVLTTALPWPRARGELIPRIAVTSAPGSPVLWLPKPCYVGRGGEKVTVLPPRRGENGVADRDGGELLVFARQ